MGISYCHNKSGKLLNHVENNLLSEPYKKGAVLDLSESREGFVGEVTVGGCLDHGDDELVELRVFSVREKSEWMMPQALSTIHL